MSPHLTINKRRIGPGEPAYIVAELSANHHHDYTQALKIVQAAAEAGADAVKLQTYTADTITICCDAEPFRIGGGTLWDGRNLHDLYQEAHTPWDWHPKLQAAARDLGIDFFSTPFDGTAVDFLERMNVPAHKIASFELVDIGLLRKVGATGKPVIMSTGMANLAEIEEAITALRDAGTTELALLKCTSAYPASPDDMNLRTIPDLAQRFELPVGLSDHTLGTAVPVTAVALGACIVEKHLALSRSIPGPDAAFSLEPQEFKQMVEAIRTAERAAGRVSYDMNPSEARSRIFRRSLFVVEDIKAGETFTEKNVRAIRPGHGLHTRHLSELLGKHAARDIPRGTPFEWSLLRK